MERSRIADEYAEALLGLVVDRNRLEEALRASGVLLNLFLEVPDLLRLMGAEHLSRQRREEIVVRVLGGRIPEYLLHFLQLMIRRGRGWYVRQALESFQLKAKEAAGRTPAWVVTAVPVPDPLKRRIERVVEELTGLDLDLDWRVDPSVLGGIRIRFGDTVLDATLRRGLRELEGLLTEIHEAASAG